MASQLNEDFFCISPRGTLSSRQSVVDLRSANRCARRHAHLPHFAPMGLFHCDYKRTFLRVDVLPWTCEAVEKCNPNIAELLCHNRKPCRHVPAQQSMFRCRVGITLPEDSSRNSHWIRPSLSEAGSKLYPLTLGHRLWGIHVVVGLVRAEFGATFDEECLPELCLNPLPSKVFARCPRWRGI